MVLIFLRHGEKSNLLSDEAESYLSPQGHRQAQTLVSLTQNGQLPKPTHLLASEFERTSQTLLPLSKQFCVTIVKKREFDLQDFNESMLKFQERVRRGLNYLQSHDSESVVYCCSHQDWLHEAISQLETQELSRKLLNSWPTARYLAFKIESNPETQWQLLQEGRVLW